MGNPHRTDAFDPLLVKHAERCWNAERENAERLGRRLNLVLSAAAALFGLGLFRIEWFRSQDEISVLPPRVAVLIKLLLLISLVAFAFAFYKLFRTTRSIRDENDHVLQASDRLRLSESVLSSPPTDPDGVRRLVFARVYRAYIDLRDRNIEKRERLEKGQQWFITGMFFVAAAISLYFAYGEPPMRG